jgi:GNAT superfamily N-acetyltransferase
MFEDPCPSSSSWRAARPTAALHAAPFGWDGISVSTEVDVGAGVALLEALRAEGAAHSWRQHLPARGALRPADVERLLESERRRRPTTFYWFSGVRAGRACELFGVATVADRIRADFPFEGFPVLARSYVAPAFRARGLYAHLLRYRAERCRARLGAALRGIHFGTAEPRVLRVARRHLPFPLTCLGEELMPLPEGPRRVADFLAFEPSYVARLRSELAALRASPCQAAFATLAVGLLERGFDPTGYGRLCDALGALERVTGRPFEAPGWRQLLAFCDAIPLLR